ncbi:alpha/beta fold hydrolase [Nocardia sp. NPDC004068]|uniref:alpha/beta fold hydrolase n=1 Tax=Nocardia sp. NPDC004068 TaxID=3364303 RepID=UPI003677198E
MAISSPIRRWWRILWPTALAVVLGVVAGVAVSHADAGPVPSAAPACAAGEEPRSPGYDAATRDDPAFTSAFRHCFTTVDGVQMHYVIGGTGPQPLVLLHGWPESWYEYHEVMPRLLPGRTVIAIDLPGLGDSTGELPSYTKTTMARYVSGLLTRIGVERETRVVAHDFGVGVAYALAAEHRDQVAGLFLMDFPLVGRNLTFASVQPLSWHFSFNVQNPLAEDLVTGRVGTFLDYFFRHSEVSEQARASATHELPVAPRSLAEYVRVYSRPQVLHAGFELYRTWSADEAENAALQQSPLRQPVRMLTQDGLSGVMLPAVRDAAPDASGDEVSGAGHWLVDQQPDRIAAEIDAFYPAS